MAPPIVKRYIIAFEKYKWIGLASFALVVAGSTVVAMQPDPPPSYVAAGSLTYTRPPVSFSATGTEIQQQGQELTEEILLSEKILKPIATKISTEPDKLKQRIAIKLPAKGKNGELETTIIDLKFKDGDPKRAAEVVQALMVAMIKESGEINTRRLKAIIQKIEERVPKAKLELQGTERRLEQYDKKERPAILAAENGSMVEAITTSQIQQRQIQLTLSGIDAQIRSLQEKLGLSVDQAYVSSAMSADPIIADLRKRLYEIESQLTVLRKDYRPKHPTMVQLQRQKEAVEQQLQVRAAEVVGGNGVAAPLADGVTAIRSNSNLDPARQLLANQLVGLQTQKETLQQQLADQITQEGRLRKEFSLIPNKQLERSRLEQEVLLKKAVYDQMQAKLTDAKTAEAETVTSLALAREPFIIADVKPPKSVPVTLGVGGFLGLIIGGGVIFLLGSLEGTFKTKEDIRECLKQREVALLGELPIMPTDDLQKDEIPVLVSPDSVYLDYYEKFRSNLRRIGGKNLKVILITSTTSQEGKTTSAYNLGVAAARAGKRTLIIETDLRSPSRCQSLGISPDPDANMEPLLYYANLSECTRLVPDIENLYMIPSAGVVRQPAAVLESSEMRRIIEDARGRYDLVILDTLPLSLSNDALLIQPYSDGIILVARPNYTQENMLTEAIDQLIESDMRLVGAIVNAADVTISIPKGSVSAVRVIDEESDEVAARANGNGSRRN